MKLTTPKNINYAATVVRVRHITTLPNCDNVVGIPVLGYQAIVSKDTQVGDLGVVFTAETQLSTAYAASNNLYRHAELNDDPTAKGYLEDNRRVKALKFRGHRSDALFMPLSSLAAFTDGWGAWSEGDTFDELNGHEICRKYVIRQPREQRPGQQKLTKKQRVDEKMLPQHFDTVNYFRVPEAIAGKDHVVLSQKLHGTSLRVGRVPVKRKLNRLERLLLWIGVAELA